MDAFVLLFTLAILLALGMPVAFAVGLSAVAGALWIDLPLEALMIQITSGVNKFTLLAIPFFILAGAIMAEGGIARRLVNFAYVFVGFIRGGLSLVNIVASTFFGAISGSSVADTASIGSVMIPEMEKKGYPREYAAAVTASGSVQAILIPPSHNSVIYSLAAGGTVSIATLFIAGVLPGLLLGVSLMVLCLCFARKRGYRRGQNPVQAGAENHARCPVGADDGGDYPRRDLVRDIHGDRICRRGLPVGVLRHHVHLPRLQVE